jgi:hypothetical protein
MTCNPQARLRASATNLRPHRAVEYRLQASTLVMQLVGRGAQLCHDRLPRDVESVTSACHALADRSRRAQKS